MVQAEEGGHRRARLVAVEEEEEQHVQQGSIIEGIYYDHTISVLLNQLSEAMGTNIVRVFLSKWAFRSVMYETS